MLNVIRTHTISVSGYRRTMVVSVCRCCAAEFETRAERISKSTGLCMKCANVQAGKTRSTHGHNNRNSRLHVTWANMKRRCINPRGTEKTKYSGVRICDEWMEFEPFMRWALANGYQDNLTIDRKDSSGDYEPNNCRFVDYSTQGANRKITKKNKSGYIGVSFELGRWSAKITWQGNQIRLGRFDTALEAAAARDNYIRKHELPHTLSVPIRDTYRKRARELRNG